MFRTCGPRTVHAGTPPAAALIGVRGDVRVPVQAAQRERHRERRQQLAGGDARHVAAW